MNTHFREPDIPLTTRAVDDMPRRRWTVAEIDAMVAKGIVDEGERFELIEVDAVPMNAKDTRHEIYKGSLLWYWIKRAPETIRIIPETTLRLGESTFLEPDLLFFEAGTRISGLNGQTALLVVEISDTTLAYDKGRKAGIYARYGVSNLWVVDVNTLDTFVFSDPSPDGYRSTHVVGPTATLVPEFAPELAVRLSELKLI